MASRPWYAFYPKDYAQKTAHLSILQHGVYRLLLDHYYMSAKPLPANAEQLHRVCRAFADAEQAAIGHILVEFFRLTPDGYVQDRVEDELRKAENLSEVRRNAANTRYAIAPAIAVQKHTQSQSQSHTQSQEQLPSKAVGAARSAQPATKASRWACDRQIPPDWIAAGHALRLKHLHPAADLDSEAEKFANFWSAKAGRDALKLDWRRTWLNWTLTSKGLGTNGSGRHSKPTAHDNFLAAAASIIDDLDGR